MSTKRFWAGALRVLLVLVVIGLVFAGGVTLGLRMAGLQAVGVRGLPDLGTFHRFSFWGRTSRFLPMFFGGGLLLRAGLFVLFVLIVGKVLRYAIWGCGPAGRVAAPHWHHPYWRGFHAPPPCPGAGEEQDEAAAKVRSDPSTEASAPHDGVTR
jgi:hypothetical protein